MERQFMVSPSPILFFYCVNLLFYACFILQVVGCNLMSHMQLRVVMWSFSSNRLMMTTL